MSADHWDLNVVLQSSPKLLLRKLSHMCTAQWHVSPNAWASHVSIEDITSLLCFFANKHLAATAANKAAMFMLATRM